MDREQVEGYFERQAMTMAIVDRFVAEGAEQEINISQECKQRVLDAEITRCVLFSRGGGGGGTLKGNGQKKVYIDASE